MKAYVFGYRPIKEQERLETTVGSDGDYWVKYSATPENWTIPERRLADVECDILRRMRVHVDAHYCEFSVEELRDGEFAVVCTTHPDIPPQKL